jgi:hypothetical protein
VEQQLLQIEREVVSITSTHTQRSSAASIYPCFYPSMLRQQVEQIYAPTQAPEAGT